MGLVPMLEGTKKTTELLFGGVKRIRETA